MLGDLKVGIIGCGNITLGGHAQVLKTLGANVIGIADPTVERRQKVQQLLGLPDGVCVPTHRELLALKPDYVVVTVPQQFRRPIVLDCAKAGVSVLSEKPIATLPADAQAMVDAMRAANLRYGMMHNYLYYSEYKQARQLIADGAIGTLRHITLNFLGVPDHPGAAEYKPMWRHDPREAGGGILMDMIHAVYLVESLMGGPIKTVSAIVDNLEHPGDRVEDFTIVNYGFDNGYATINMWWGNGPGGVEISGTKGRIMAFYKNYGTGPFTTLESFTLVNEAGRQSFDPRLNDHATSDGFYAIHKDFAAAVREGRDPIAPAEAGLRALQATLGAYAAAAIGHIIDLPLAADHPVFVQGSMGMRDLDIRLSGPLQRKRLFGLGDQ